MLRKRRAHVERTMAVVSQIASADAHVLADRMMRTRTTVMREEARPSETVRDGGGAANGEKKKDTDDDSFARDAFGASPSRVDRPEIAETDFEEGVTRLAADALRGDGTALGKTRRGLFRIGLSRSSKHRYTPDGAPAARAGSFVARARRALPSQNALLESIAVRLPESTLIRFELFFLRAHNVRSLKFDFPEYVMECIDWDSCDTLGMSPGRWCIATVIILVMGPFENINLIVSVVSVCVILGLAAWLKTRVDLVLRAEKRGDGVTDAQLFLLGRPRLAKELFIAILYQQAFHVATWIFGAWQIGVGDGYGCYYGQTWSVLVSAGTVLVSLLVGGYVILPLDALLAQMSGHFRSELLDARVTDVVKQLAASLDRRRRGTRRFATEEQAVLHIQRAFRERKKRNLGRAAKLALMHAASGKMADRGRAGGGGDVRVDVGDDVR